MFGEGSIKYGHMMGKTMSIDTARPHDWVPHIQESVTASDDGTKKFGRQLGTPTGKECQNPH